MNNLPSAPSFQDSSEYADLFESLRSEAKSQGEAICIAESERRLASEYKAWEDTFFGQHTSTTNRKLQFYKIAQDVFPNLDLRASDRVLSIILSQLPKVGDTIEVPNRKTTGQVIRREITSRLGILFTIKLNDDSLVSHEFFD